MRFGDGFSLFRYVFGDVWIFLINVIICYVYNLNIKAKKITWTYVHMGMTHYFNLFVNLYVRTKVTISLKTVSGQLILIWHEEQQQQKILKKVASKAKL